MSTLLDNAGICQGVYISNCYVRSSVKAETAFIPTNATKMAVRLVVQESDLLFLSEVWYWDGKMGQETKRPGTHILQS